MRRQQQIPLSNARWLLLTVAVFATEGTLDTDRAQAQADTARAVDAGTETAAELESELPAGDETPAATVAQGQPPLRVGFVGSPPFVHEGAPPDGLSIGVWRLVADGAGVHYDLEPSQSVAAALRDVAAGKLDVAVGPISITSARARSVDFTQPYFQAPIGVLSSEQTASAWDRVAPFLGRMFAGASLILLLALLGVGTAVWLLERKQNPEHFPPNPVQGIGNGLWFALVTMTTVGYGDRAPVTVPGRVLTGLWMLIALVTTTSLTAGFAGAFAALKLDVVSIETASDLRGQMVAVVDRTTGASFARSHGARLVPFASFEDAVQSVEAGETRALVHDRPMLRHYLARNPSSTLQLADHAYQPTGYGFAIAPGRIELLRKLDIALLAAQEDGQLEQVVAAWLGASEP